MYAFFGFESSTFAIEETIEPARNTPLSLLISLSLTLVLYCSSSLSLVLMKPFDTIDVHASYPDAFASVRLVYLIVSIGPLISMSGGLVSNVYAIVRLAFNMAKDGLLFRCFGQVDARTKIPRVATIISMTLCMALVLAIDIKDLIGFVDISGFLTYSLVAMGLLVLRYFDFDYDNDDHDHDHGYGEPRVSFVLFVYFCCKLCCYLINERQAAASDANGGAHDKRRRRRRRHVATPLEQPRLWHFVECRVARSDRTGRDEAAASATQRTQAAYASLSHHVHFLLESGLWRHAQSHGHRQLVAYHCARRLCAEQSCGRRSAQPLQANACSQII